MHMCLLSLFTLLLIMFYHSASESTSSALLLLLLMFLFKLIQTFYLLKCWNRLWFKLHGCFFIGRRIRTVDIETSVTKQLTTKKKSTRLTTSNNHKKILSGISYLLMQCEVILELQS